MRALISMPCAAMVTAVLCGVASAQSFDAVGNFSVNSNPNGTWAYGYAESLGGFVALPSGTCGNLTGWANGEPWVLANLSSSSSTNCGTDTGPSDVLHLHPGFFGEYSVVRWIAPYDAMVNVTTRFTQIDFAGGTTTDVHMLVNGIPAGAGDIGGSAQMVDIAANLLSLSKGDMIDFAVGYGENKDYFFDSTGLSVQIEATRRVVIDIHPGSFPNGLNPRSRGKTPVAILSSVDFNAVAEVDPTSLTFGRIGIEQSLAFCNQRGEDVNADGLLDLVCHFATAQTGFTTADVVGVLRGETYDGVPISGTDSVKIAGH